MRTADATPARVSVRKTNLWDVLLSLSQSFGDNDDREEVRILNCI